jgi:FkbM family methyltransferase
LTRRILRPVSIGERLRTFRDVAAVIREPLRLGVRRAEGRSTIGRYRLRASDIVVFLRHDVLDDLATLVQTFREDHYAPPLGAVRALDALGRPPRAMDLGANIGMFGAWFLGRHPGARVTAYEAEPGNALVHARTVDANVPRHDWEVRAAAAATADGEVRFLSGRGAHSRLAGETDGDAELVTVPAEDVLARAGEVDFLKIDIEGAEWELLADDRFAALPARVVSLEYHAERCPQPDPREAALDALLSAGFEVAEAALHARPGHGMVWGWRKA